MADWFEIRHRATGEFMLEIVDVEFERAREIAADLSGLADWAALSTTYELMLQAKLMAFGIGYPGEVVANQDWGSLGDLDRIVRYGER